MNWDNHPKYFEGTMLETVLLPILMSGAVSASIDFDLISASHVSKALKCAALATHQNDGDSANKPADPPNDGSNAPSAAQNNSLPDDKRGGDGFSFGAPNHDSDNHISDNNHNRPF